MKKRKRNIIGVINKNIDDRIALLLSFIANVIYKACVHSFYIKGYIDHHSSVRTYNKNHAWLSENTTLLWGSNKLISDDTVLLGEGISIVRYRKWIYLISIYFNPDEKSTMLTAYTLFESKMCVLKEAMFSKQTLNGVDNDSVFIYLSNSYGGFYAHDVCRTLDTIHTRDDKHLELLSSVNRFLNNKEYYTRHNLPYKMIILIHGEPGTGKSSLIRWLATQLKISLAVSDFDTIFQSKDSSRSYLENLNGNILVLEDIDASTDILDSREQGCGDLTNNSNNNNTAMYKDITMTLSGVLNAFDGITDSAKGKIIIMTTNHIDQLDPAFIRPGRIDLLLEVKKLDKKSVKEYSVEAFPEMESIPVDKYREMPVAELSNHILVAFGDVDKFKNLVLENSHTKKKITSS